MSDPTYTIYSYFRSSCSARLRIVLNLKGIDYDMKTVNLLKGDHLSSEHKARNPTATVPLLVHTSSNGNIFKIGQSVAAIEYLEEVHPQSYHILPPTSNPEARAITRTLAGIIACDLQPVTNMKVMKRVRALGASAEQWNKEIMTEVLGAYEAVVKDWAGQYSVGDDITLADVCLLPAVWGAQRYGVDIDTFPTIAKISENLSKHPAVIKAHWQNQPDTPEELRAK
ncbi:maleylacetoacetate isomerase [Trichoderma arundinaceum]|uniref:Maleylacetoacetate isomerase n=1 Tax=Trichoderma arundinaceum TaxID=490622 RepID=A0A395P025_TRIAR|nr:maleylacetoacetate isomerase [Trichoderma arundinaceum]